MRIDKFNSNIRTRQIILSFFFHFPLPVEKYPGDYREFALHETDCLLAPTPLLAELHAPG